MRRRSVTAPRTTARRGAKRRSVPARRSANKRPGGAARGSVATVSRVHNESGPVTEGTRRRVRAVATRLGYAPHAAARTLSTNRTSTVGVLLPDLYGEFYSELIRGIDQTAQRHGYHLLVASSHDRKPTIEAALQSLRGPGVRATPAWEIPGDFTETSGFAACLKLLAERSPLRPTAIFAANDAMAIGALSALREAHVQVPGDMAVAGFDDIPMARYMHPPLSTVRVNISALGERATRRLLDAVANGRQHQKRRETLPVTLVIRESCGGRGQPATASPP